MKTVHAVLATILLTVGPLVARAAVIEFDPIDQGWLYKITSQASHSPTNPSVFAGGSGYHNFFLFDLSGLTSEVVSASWQYFTFHISNNFSANYEIWDVDSAALPTLTNGIQEPGEWNDLASGTRYGFRAYSHADSNQTFSIELNAAAITDINAAAGDLWAIGGDMRPGGGIFSGSGTHGAFGLIIETADVPTPGTYMLFLLGLAFLTSLGGSKSDHPQVLKVRANDPV